jgi:hypothetical protein
VKKPDNSAATKGATWAKEIDHSGRESLPKKTNTTARKEE